MKRQFRVVAEIFIPDLQIQNHCRWAEKGCDEHHAPLKASVKRNSSRVRSLYSTKLPHKDQILSLRQVVQIVDMTR
jgi:predicted ABC-class ATPase